MKDMYNFEKNLKKKLDEAEFPFDEKNWEKASAMIDASRSNKKPFWFFILSAVALLITTGAVYFFYNSSPDSSSENLLAVNGNKISSAEVTQVSNFVVETENISKTPTLSNVQTENKNTSVQTESNTDFTSDKIKKSNTKLDNSEAISNLKNKNILISNSINTKQKTKSNSTEKTSTLKNTKHSTTPPSENQLSKNSGNDEKTKSETSKEIPVVLGSNLINNNPVKTISNNTLENGNSNKLGEIILPGNPNTTTNNVSFVTDSVIEVRTVTANTLMVNSTDSVNKQIMPATDSSAILMSIAVPFQVKKTTDFLYAEAGASYLLGWNSNGIQEANGFNLVAGFNYQHYFNTNISLGIGMQYTSINNLSQSTYTVSRVNYDFGVSKDITSIKYLRLHYVTVPIKLGFNAGKYNIIGVGANISMLLTDEYRDERYHTNNAEPMTENNQLSTKKGNGYFTGFNPYDIQASVFYRRKLAKGLSINAEFGYGLMDIKTNTHFKNGNFERSTGGKLTICYDLFKK